MNISEYKRTIEFQAWSLKDKIMIDEKCFAFEEYAPLTDLFNSNDNFILREFTGLYDRNCNKIFEFDIVTDKFNNIACIKYINGAFCCYIKNRNSFYDISIYEIKHELEIIGNIFSNPELAEKFNIEV